MSNSDRVVLVLGGAGIVGSGIVKALLDKGFKVAVISRDSSRLERLRSFVSPTTEDNLTTVVGNVGRPKALFGGLGKGDHLTVELVMSFPENPGSEEGAVEAKRALLGAVGKVTDVVSSLGFSWWQGGPPHTQALKDLHWVMEALLFSTFVSWKVFFPLVRDDSSCTYTFITGGAGEKLLMPGTGFLTIGAASSLAFCQVLREEFPEVPCKLNQVRIDAGVATPERPTPGYLDNLELGEAVASLVERRSSSHTVFSISCPADLKTALLERNL